MTEQVRVEGHNVPQPGGQNIPPRDPQPGFVPNPVQTTQPQGDPAPAAEVKQDGNGAGLEAALAAVAAALAAQSPKPTPEPAAGDESLNDLDLSSISDPVLRSMATAMRVAGPDLDMDRVFAKALETGDPNFLDVAYIKEKAGDKAGELITIAQGIIDGVNREATGAQQDVYNSAGGEAQWNACTASFNKAAPEGLRSIVATMLNSGDRKLIKGAADLVVQFAKGSGFVPNAQPLLESGAATVSAALALGKDEFQAELRKLDANARDFIPKRNELFARRAAGKQLGK